MKQLVNNTYLKTNILLFLTLISFLNGFGQNKIGVEVQNLQRNNTQFVPISLLTSDGSISTKEISQAVNAATVAKVNLNKVNEIASNTLDFLELEIPYQNQKIQILLYRVDPFAKDFKIDTDKQNNIEYQKGA